MRPEEIIEQMKNMGISAGNVLNATANTESLLNGLSTQDMPDDLKKHLDEALSTTREGRVKLKSKMDEIEKTLERNGDNNSK